MQIESFFDQSTSTLTHLIHDGHAAAVIDPVRAFDTTLPIARIGRSF